jgi:Protein of unknown function (DUF1173)
MARYKIANFEVDSSDSAFQIALAQAYNAPNIEEVRPRCLCRRSEPGHERDEGIPMYISRLGDTYLCKRMPNSAQDHTAECDSYELPPEMTGYGAVLGSAIQEGPDGVTTLKLDFSLTDGGGRAPTSAGDSDKTEVASDGRKLSLRATLHYLWHQAELNQWAPGFAGKRNWWMIWNRIRAAMKDKATKGLPLADILFVPEPFRAEAKNAIAARRLSALSKIASEESGKKRLMLLIAEYKEVQHTQYGHNLIAKHMPDFPLLMDESIFKRFSKAFSGEFEILRAHPNFHLLIIGTFSFSDLGIASLKRMDVMLVDENWIPFEDMYEKQIIDALTAGQRRFDKVLRFNTPPTYPQPSVVLRDAAPKTAALYIVHADADEGYYKHLHEQAAKSKFLAWRWDLAQDAIPALPISMDEARRIDQESGA